MTSSVGKLKTITLSKTKCTLNNRKSIKYLNHTIHEDTQTDPYIKPEVIPTKITQNYLKKKEKITHGNP